MNTAEMLQEIAQLAGELRLGYLVQVLIIISPEKLSAEVKVDSYIPQQGASIDAALELALADLRKTVERHLNGLDKEAERLRARLSKESA